jgi:hypothetical protein
MIKVCLYVYTYINKAKKLILFFHFFFDYSKIRVFFSFVTQHIHPHFRFASFVAFINTKPIFSLSLSYCINVWGKATPYIHRQVSNTYTLLHVRTVRVYYICWHNFWSRRLLLNTYPCTYIDLELYNDYTLMTMKKKTM